MSDKTYAAQLAIKREECIIKLAMVLPNADDAERVYAEAYDRWLEHPTGSLDEAIDALQLRIILEGWPLDGPEPKGIRG